jgi:uncharacterized protein (TIGR00369 family)
MPTQATIPEGFAPFTRISPLIRPWLPIYASERDDRVVLALTVAEPHLNRRDTVHGGLLAALADQAMGMSCAIVLRSQQVPVANLWTSSLTVDYLAASRPGQWLAFDTIFARVGKTLCHAEIDITADGATVARARATFRTQSSSSSS